MRDTEIGSVQREWLARKASDANISMERFLAEKYLELHSDEPRTEFEKMETIRRRIFRWKKQEEAYQAASDAVPDSPGLEEWQAAEMLDNVIIEMSMTDVEQHRYLLNAKLLAGYQITNGSNDKQLRQELEQEYKQRWIASEDGVSKAETQNLFAEVMRLLQYVGAGYDDETRYILAKIGAGQDASFHVERSAMEKEDQRLLADFLVSEMVLSDESTQLSEQEKKLVADQVVPVCVSAADEAQTSRNPVRSKKLVHSLIASICTTENAKVLACAAVVILAAQAAVLVLEIAAAGAVASIGMKALWKCCKEQELQPAAAMRALLSPKRKRVEALEDTFSFDTESIAENETMYGSEMF